MVGVQVCRLCLVMDVKLHNLQSYPLETYYNSVIGPGNVRQNKIQEALNYIFEDIERVLRAPRKYFEEYDEKSPQTVPTLCFFGICCCVRFFVFYLVLSLSILKLPPYACYECAALIKKFYFFKQKCLRSQVVLNGVTDNCGKLSRKAIKAIDRQSIHIASPLELVIMPEVNIVGHKYSSKDNNLEAVLDAVKPYLTGGTIKEKDHEYLIIISDYDVSSDNDELFNHKNQTKEQKETEIEDVEEVLEGLTADHKDHKIDKNETKIEDVEEVLESFEPYDIDVSSDNDELIEYVDEVSEDLEVNHKDHKKDQTEAEFDDVEEELEGLEFTEATDNILDIPEISEKKIGRSNHIDSTPTKNLNNLSLGKGRISDVRQYATVISLTIQEQMEEVNKRKESSNYLNATYKCELCFKGFLNTDAWNHHVSKHSLTAGDVECQICKFRFKSKTAMNKHAVCHRMRYACKSCSTITTSLFKAKLHEGRHKGVTFTCQYCGEIFNVFTSYMGHVRIKHPSEFICGVCGYSFVNKLGLARHKSRMHKDILEKFDVNEEEGQYCAECDIKFLSTEAFKRHMVMSVKHTDNSDFSTGCRNCGEKFNTLEELRLHQRKGHSKKWPKHYGKKSAIITWPTKCEHCSKEIQNAREYSAHFRYAHPDKHNPVAKNIMCDICGKSFRAMTLLDYHKRRHFNERNYKCTQCDKSFFTPTILHLHKRVHSDNRPFPCSLCSKAFKCKQALVRHLRSHTNEKPYKCEICGKFFTTACGVKLHVRTVHQKLPAPPRKRRERRKAGQKEPQK